MDSFKVMICEDEMIFAMDLKQRLINFGCEVVGVANNAEDAFKIAENFQPELALMDVRLKGELNGTEIAAVLDKKYDIPCVFLTGMTDEEIVEKASLSNAIGYLVKPVSDHNLEMTLRFAQKRARTLKAVNKNSEIYRNQMQEMEKILDKVTNVENKTATHQAMDVISAEVAHHINNSLTALLGSLEILEMSSELPSFEVRQLKYIKEACERQKGFVKRLLWAAESGAYEWDMQPLGPLLHRTILKTQENLPSSVKLNLQLPPEPISMFISSDAVAESIGELLNNAIYAVDSAGQITVSVQKQYLTSVSDLSPEAKPGMYCVISVEDNGKGIPQEELNKVLEPFYTTARERDVAGLGLAVANGVARAHGGGIRIESQEGRGTVVQFCLPIEVEQDEQKTATDSIAEQEDSPERRFGYL